jgi:hypothetical protein
VLSTPTVPYRGWKKGVLGGLLCVLGQVAGRVFFGDKERPDRPDARLRPHYYFSGICNSARKNKEKGKELDREGKEKKERSKDKLENIILNQTILQDFKI